ncbi:amidase [Thozetella sp. PMI_491]|nr:amidase [Thozetella sp. PMI_491]
MEPYKLTGSEALALFRSGSLMVEDYAKSLLRRIAQRDAQVKAWEHIDPAYVLDEARNLDKIPPESRGPLHGVSIGVKDIIYTKGMPTQYNSAIYKGDAPEVDAASIAVLRNAGALILGKCTTTEFAATGEGPKTCNPNDLTRTPGGSSSGSAAAVADFQVAISLGSQTGGSTIRPGSFNGIYALKPTWNSISREGQRIHSLTMDTIGFFARSVDDLNLLADVFSLADDTLQPSAFSLHGARFALARTVVWPEAGPGTIAAIQLATKLLRDQGATVDEIDLPEFGKMPDWHRTVVECDGRTSFLPEYRLGKSKLHQDLINQVENTNQVSRAAQLEAFDGIAALRPKIDKIASMYAAIITPSVPDVAPEGQEWTGNQNFNRIWTALHTPVINIPGFKGENDLPVGLSLVAPRYYDRHLLAVARAVGDLFEAKGGWNRSV